MTDTLKCADFYKDDYIVRICMYYSEDENSIYVTKTIISELDSYTDRMQVFESQDDEKADIMFRYYCDQEIAVWRDTNVSISIPDIQKRIFRPVDGVNTVESIQ